MSESYSESASESTSDSESESASYSESMSESASPSGSYADNIIGAIKILLDQAYTEHTDIGLYTPISGNSELRFSEAELFGVDETYNHEMLLRDGIGEITESVTDELGGNLSDKNDFSFSLKGTNQIILRLLELGIQLSGKTVQYIEFRGIDEDSDYTSVQVYFTGTIEDYEYNEFSVDITAKSSFSAKRNRLLADRASAVNYPDIDENINGETVPLAFGRSDPDNGRYFKLRRIEFRDDILTNNELLGGYDDPKNLNNFPTAVVSPANQVCFLLTDDGSENGYNAKENYDIEGKYIKITETDETQSEAVGLIRKINLRVADSVSDKGPTYDRQALAVQLSKYLHYELLGSPHTGGDYGAWVNVIDLLVKYILDSGICKGFISTSDLYVKTDDVVEELVNVGISQEDPEIPCYEISGESFKDDVNNINSFFVLNAAGVEAYESPTGNLDVFGITLPNMHFAGGGDVPGVFSAPAYTCSAQSLEHEEYAIDRDYTTYFRNQVTVNAIPSELDNYVMVTKILLPEISDDMAFDHLYLGLKLKSIATVGTYPNKVNGNMIVARRGYYNKIFTIEKEGLDFYEMFNAESLPDEYYTNSPDEDDKEFYLIQDTEHLVTGYRNFDLEISSVEEYRNIHELVVMFNKKQNDEGGWDSVLIYGVAFIFERNKELGREVFA